MSKENREIKTQANTLNTAQVDNLHPADVADRLEDLPLEKQRAFILSQPLEVSAQYIAEMERHERVELMSTLPPAVAADLLEEMSPDDATDILSEMDPDVRAKILKRLEKEDAVRIKDLLKFDPETAGGVMNTEILVLDRNLTADQAIQLIRDNAGEIEIPYYAYIVDEQRHLIGVLSLRDLLLSPPAKTLNSLLQERNQQLVFVTYDQDKEEVARLLSKYDLLAIPVVDYEMRLLGIVTVDDVIDIIQEEASEDMQTMVGAGSDETLNTPWIYSVKKRLPWLILNVFNSIISASVVNHFQGTIAQMAVLAVLMPIVANQAGNTGQQALAVMIRQLALEAFQPKKFWRAVLKEARVGAVNGLIVAVLVYSGVYLWTHNFKLAMVMGVALVLDMIFGAVAGASIPLILKALGRDPAHASTIFLTTLTDSGSFFTFLGLASLFLFR
ncbi:MAG: magnesium transporter [Desulfonauticus sp.]|nr:magnesium transporter [Desulfonauticus sp.]